MSEISSVSPHLLPAPVLTQGYTPVQLQTRLSLALAVAAVALVIFAFISEATAIWLAASAITILFSLAIHPSTSVETTAAFVLNPDRCIIPEIPEEFAEVVHRVPPFTGYKIGKGTPYEGRVLSAFTVRPANLFYEALLGQDSTTQPGSGEAFKFLRPLEEIRAEIFSRKGDEVISVSAQGKQGRVSPHSISDLAAVYGDKTWRFSMKEVQAILNSQRVYLSPYFPKAYYLALKKALQELNYNHPFLPGHPGSRPKRLAEVEAKGCQDLVRQVKEDFKAFGFNSEKHAAQILDLTLYQLGCLVAKAEDFYVFLDDEGKIRERQPGEKDALRLISSCGMRDFHRATTLNRKAVIKEAFKAALVAAGTGYLVCPAVGMGVWGGDPGVYWPAFFEAVMESGDALEAIFVNPGHRATPPQRSGRSEFVGAKGEEFQLILEEYLKKTEDLQGHKNLQKIINLLKQNTDLVLLATNLKRQYPDKTVSLFNASDPDVTLGNHVGEYVNNLSHPPTTEENFTALGTNGISFEKITGVLEDDSRVIQICQK